MKRNLQILILSAILFGVWLSGCNMPDNDVDPGILYTMAAETIQAENDRIASLTPPTPTATITPTPTITPTATVTPTATIVPSPTWVNHAAGEAEVLVLYYNDIAESYDDDPYYQWESEANVRKAEFEQQVRMLYELGYTSIGLSDLIKVLYEGGELPPRPVLFTFDSSQLGQYRNAYPILKRYGMKGNLMLVAGQVDTKNCLTSDQIREMMADGWELGCSGYWGNDMINDPSKIGEEIGKSKILLEEKFGVDIQVFAYPGGITDAEGRMASRVSEYLYKAAFGKHHTVKHSMNNIFYLGRYEIMRGLSYNDFLAYLPWQEGTISQETMNWTLETPTAAPADSVEDSAAGDAPDGAEPPAEESPAADSAAETTPAP